ncbi:MAG: endonuclease III [Spirochaetales bacterium]|nr:endonuclease III [Spirochaetales bacterium]
MDKAGTALKVHQLLDELYPGKLGFLTYNNPYELMISVILSAQTTDKQVNQITGNLFKKYPEPADLAGSDQQEVEQIIKSSGYYHAKARNIIGAAGVIHNEFDDIVPDSMDLLLKIPGVGRKSANVVLGAIFNQPAIIVDTHFGRVVRRIGLCKTLNPEKVEREIKLLLAPELQYRFSMTINTHGRVVCHARNPECEKCTLLLNCERVGVKGV